MAALKAHPFFEGIDFSIKLIDMNMKELVRESEPESSKPKPKQSLPSEVENSKFTVPADGRPVLSGNILKKNRFYMQ